MCSTRRNEELPQTSIVCHFVELPLDINSYFIFRFSTMKLLYVSDKYIFVRRRTISPIVCRCCIIHLLLQPLHFVKLYFMREGILSSQSVVYLFRSIHMYRLSCTLHTCTVRSVLISSVCCTFPCHKIYDESICIMTHLHGNWCIKYKYTQVCCVLGARCSVQQKRERKSHNECL